MYYCEACRVKNNWPKGEFQENEPYPADEDTSCQECGATNVPYWGNSGWKLPKKIEPPEPVTWRSYNVVSLCEAMRKEQKFDNLPILADALEDAGCHDPSL